MRDAGDRWDPVDRVHAVSGVKISAVDLDDVLAGTTLHVITNDEEEEIAWMKAKEESTLSLELQDNGVCIKSDTLGGLSAFSLRIRREKYQFVQQVLVKSHVRIFVLQKWESNRKNV